MKVTLRNISTIPLRVLLWLTALEPPLGHDTLLFVICDDKQVPYEARSSMYGGGTPAASDYILIAPGGAVTNEFDLTTLFPHMKGHCNAHWHGMIHDVIDDPRMDVRPDNNTQEVVVDCNRPTVNVLPREPTK